jgi:hypothetical protein
VTSPYRIKDEVSQKERPSAELVYSVSDQEKHVAPIRTAIQIGTFGAASGIVAAAVGSPELGAILFLGAAALAVWRWRRAPGVGGLLLQVDDGALVVTDRCTRKVVARTRLPDLRNVSLDTKSIRKVEPGRDAIPAVQFINTQIGPEIDVARIILEVNGRTAPIHLTDSFLAHTESVESVGKIRVFLRSHGWLPEDERPRGSDPDSDGDDIAAPEDGSVATADSGAVSTPRTR